MSTLTWAVAAVLTDEAGRVLLCRRDRGGRWALPGGRLHRPGCPTAAVAGEVLRETGCAVEIVDLVGLYHLSGSPCGGPPTPDPLPDVLVHVFRARTHRVQAATPPAGCTLSWHSPDRLPAELTPVTRAAVADARAGCSGVLRDLRPDPATRMPTPPGRPGVGTAPEAGTPPEEAAATRTRPDGATTPAGPAGGGPQSRAGDSVPPAPRAGSTVRPTP